MPGCEKNNPRRAPEIGRQLAAIHRFWNLLDLSSTIRRLKHGSWPLQVTSLFKAQPKNKTGLWTDWPLGRCCCHCRRGARPAVPLVIWSFSFRWYFPDSLPSELSLRAWKYVFSDASGVPRAMVNSLLVATAVL